MRHFAPEISCELSLHRISAGRRALAITVALGGWLAAAISAAGTPDSQGTIQNVLFIVADDLKASVLGCYADTVCQTPHIDRLARAGLLFEHAYCQGTSCQPSRQSFMLSR